MKTPPALWVLTVGFSILFFAHHDANAQLRRGGGAVDRSAEGPRGGSIDAEGERYGRFRSGSVEASGPNGGTYEASGTAVGRFGTGSRSATGADGGSYNASATRVGPYRERNVTAEGPNGGSYSATSERFVGYRSNAVYVNGAYRPAHVTVNSLYVAPLGAFAGWSILTQPYYASYPVYASYPIETAVQVELKRQGYYQGPIDGNIGPASSAAIRKYQAANDLVATGQINEALLVSLGIKSA